MMIEPTEDGTSSRIKEEIELHNMEVKYGDVVHFFHKYIFGKGDHWYYSLLWGTISLCCLIAQVATETDGYAILFNVALLVELVANMRFGYIFNAEQQLTKMLYYYKKKYDLDVDLVIKYLNYGSYFTIIYLLLVMTLSFLDMIVAYVTGDITITAMIINAFVIVFSDFFILGTSIYLCVVWCVQIFATVVAFDSFFLKCLIRIEEITTPYGNPSTISFATDIQDTQHNIIRSSVIHQHRAKSIKIISPFHLEEASQRASNVEIAGDKSYINKINNWKWFGRSAQHHDNFPSILKREILVESHTNNDDQHSESRQSERDSSACAQCPVIYIYDQQRVEKKIFFFLEELRELADYWQMNHLIRIGTGIIIVSNMAVGFYIAALMDINSFRAAMCLSVVIIYYMLIWCTALSAGYINDFVFGESINKLARLYSELRIVDESIDRQIGQTMNKLSSLNGNDGVHFAGVTITMDIAISVGSILASFLSLCVNYFCAQATAA